MLVWSTGADTGGQGLRIAEAFEQHEPTVTVWSRAAADSVLGYRAQVVIPLRERKNETLARYREADVIHLRNNLSGWQAGDRGEGKPTLVHHHGSQFRSNHGRLAHEARLINAVQLAATLDLTLLEPDVTWVPSPYDVDTLSRMRTYRADGKVRIGYFPTSPGIKSAPAFANAYRLLSKSHPVELVTNVVAGRVRFMNHHEVLRAKAGVDILFDQVRLGYGNNAVEAWCMSIPVVAGVEEPATRRLMVETFGELPFVEATEGTILETLTALVEDPRLRDAWGKRGLAHVRRFHDYPVVAHQLKQIYQTAPRTYPNPHLALTTPRAWDTRRRSMREANMHQVVPAGGTRG